MKSNLTATAVSGNGATHKTYKVYGTVRDRYQQLMTGVTIRAYSKSLRGRKLLGEAVTAANGTYTIGYTLMNSNTTGLIIGAYDAKNTLLKESGMRYKVPAMTGIDIDLSDKPFAGIAEYDRLMNIIAPFAEEVPLTKMTETADNPDISFIVQKTGLTRHTVEKLVMAARFGSFSSLPANVWYGMLSQNKFSLNLILGEDIAKTTEFEGKLNKNFDTLINTPVDTLIDYLQKSIDGNVIAYAEGPELENIRKQLSEQLLAYARQHPITGESSALYQKVKLGGLKETELQEFIRLGNNHTGTGEDFWQQLQKTPALKSDKKAAVARAVFEVAKLTGNNLSLTSNLVKTQKIISGSDVKKLAAYSRQDWVAILKKHKITPDAAIPGKNKEEKIKNYAARLAASFAREYPTAAFAARLQKDTKSKLPHRDKISKFLQKNEHFDLSKDHIGTFLKENKNAVSQKDAAGIADQVRRIQRVFKLTPDYDNAAVLLHDNIHSAHQLYKMGQNNFVETYSDKLGKNEVTQIFQKAATIHARALALAGNLRSIADASAIKAFPDFNAVITRKMAQDLPDLETLFGHTDYFDSSECNSVYGAPAYLTDILHYLDKRGSLLPATGGIIPSVKDILLRRRPDIGDIDLECNNTNTEVPYIDIACEIMEDYIAPPVITLANSFLASLVKGTISTPLLTEIKNQLVATGQANNSGLLSASATVSNPYTAKRLQADNTYLLQTHWIIRDAQITLRASSTTGTGTVEFRVLRQALLPTEAINAGPEYINTNVYNNFLRTAKRPFSLPFDLFEAGGELYLQKLGVTKADLINTFRKEDKAPPGASISDIRLGYASLGILEAEQALIFTADVANQSLYWGPAAAGTAIQVDVFEKLTGLNYLQVVNLVKLQFVNPAKDTVIEHDDLSADTTRQRITNLNGIKLDAMHRFLRLWRKTTLTMDELDAIIMAPLIGQGKIANKLALQLYQFFALQQKLHLSVFQLLAFYQNIDTTHDYPDCLYNQMFQNSAITNPVSVNFSISAAAPGTLGIAEADKAVIAAVLQVSINDVNALIAKTFSRIAIPALSGMYRYAQLAQSLDISLSDLLTLVNLIDANPFQDLQATTLFMQKYKLLQSSGFSTHELNYILRHQDDVNNSIIPSNVQVSAALSQLQNELLAVRAITRPAPDSNGLLLTKWLSDSLFKWDVSLLNKLLDILNTTDDADYQQKVDNNSNLLLNLRMLYHDALLTADLPALPLTTATPAVPIVFPASVASQLSYDADKKLLGLTGYMSTADKTVLLALSADTAYQGAINVLYNLAQQTDSTAANIFFATAADINTGLKSILGGNTAGRFAFFISKLSPVYKKLLEQNVLVKDISTWFITDKKVITQLLSSVPGIYTDFANDNFVNKVAVLPVPYAEQTNRYLFIAKVCFIASKLKLTDADLAFILAHAADIGSLNFSTLPVAAVTTAVTTFSTFEAFINLLKFQQYYPAKGAIVLNTPLSIYSILTDAISQGILTGAALVTYTASLVTNLSLLTGWNAADLTALISPPTNYITLTLPADIKSVPVLLRLHQRFAMLQQLGISVIDAFSWAKDTLLATDTSKIKQVLKQKYSSTDWLQVSKPLQDTLREKKRDALIAYLLANPGSQAWQDTGDLYSYFLLDVEMCSCQPTSRIVQATNTVQLFVQRCFMQLEENIVVDTRAIPDWQQWQWMKNFRLWQANIKVFLYPENLVEPELLPAEIKSPFFKALEDDLLQNEATAANIEDAFQTYLEKLDDVARLEIKGMWYDDFSGILHVIGRTYGGDPKIYYYRQLVNNKRWTPWIKVDGDITSDHIVPIVYNNRLYLFWAIITEDGGDAPKTIDVPKVDTPYTLTPPNKNWHIQMAYSEYKSGKWTPKKMSNADNSGQVIINQSTFPFKENFVIVPFDLPDYDYAGIFGANNTPVDTLPVFNQKIASSLKQNGTLVINCYYNKPAPDNGSFDVSIYLGGFELDAIKGYPSVREVGYNVNLHTVVGSVFKNMLLTEKTPDPTGEVSNNVYVPNKAKGEFRKLVSTQMTLNDRMSYMSVIYQQGLTNLSQPIEINVGTNLPYFYQDLHRTYYVVPEASDNGDFEWDYIDFNDALFVFMEKGLQAYQDIVNEVVAKAGSEFKERFYNFNHPHTRFFMKRLLANGVDSLMDRDTQLKNDFAFDNKPDELSFQDYYHPGVDVYTGSKIPVTYPNGVVDNTPGYPKEDVNFDLRSGYGLYNWELFFHAPLMIAERLSQNQQFDDADRWYKYIFNPMDTSPYSAPNKFWNTKPFFETTSQAYLAQRIDNVLKGINSGQQSDLLKDVTDWRNNPFQPHFIAEYRTVAYQKVAVMKYIGHLVRYGDYLFGQHTMESVNQATQLYILAAEILGPRPEVLPSVARTAVDNYYQLEQKLDAMSDAMVNVENLLPFQTVKGYTGTTPAQGLPNLQTMYFSIPGNENMVGPTGFWNTVEDRLFKIRHCMNIDGTLAPLSLFAPPIDPGMLVRAAAAGLDIGDILNDLNAPLPFYRFNTMIQKATELSNEVKSLGTAMLSVLEKKDAEALSLLRSGQEIKILGATLLLKQKQIQDAQSAIDNLDKQKELITVRRQYYSGLINTGLSDGENHALDLNKISLGIETAIAAGYVLTGGLRLIPEIILGISGFGGTPHGTVQTGGNSFASSAEAAVKTLSSIATASDKLASVISTQSGYDRRSDEWQYQVNLAGKELEQIDKQIAGAKIRLEIASQDASNQQLLIEQAGETNDFMRSKFTNEDLYNWMITQVSNTYFKSYQLAYDIAKQTERCFRYELGLNDSAYVNFGYWDSLKKGLMAGEQLSYDLKVMEMAWYEQNKRELELTKPVSLSSLDPVALLKLKTTGECWINLPEEVFDMDYPGHYMRRIKSVSITIPCISGPYTTVSCKLTMTNNSVRTSALSSGDSTQYPRKMTSGTSPIPADDPRFRDAIGALQSIATSTAQNDSGLFELNFRDDRYLPFEGSGAISLWHLELPAAVRQFDYDTISDVIIHLKYTARDGGDALKANATASLSSKINQMLVSTKDRGLMRIFSAKNDLSTEWYRFLHPVNTTDDQVLALNLDKNRFPLLVQGRTIKIRSVELVANSTLTPVNNIQLVAPASAPDLLNLTATGIYGSCLSASIDYSNNKKDPGAWLIKNLVANARLTDSALNNLVIIVHYEVS